MPDFDVTGSMSNLNIDFTGSSGKARVTEVVEVTVKCERTIEIPLPSPGTLLRNLLHRIDVLVEVVLALLQEREKLGLEIDMCEGGLTEDEFFDALEGYPRLSLSTDTLLDHTRVLVHSLPISVDSELVSTVFGCDLDAADQAISSVYQESVEKGLCERG